MLINDSLEIKLIDFEAAKKLSQDFQVDIATPGFTNDAVCNYEQQDWYAFAVIVHRLFVPICPLYYLAPSLLFCQDYMVQKHFVSVPFQTIFVHTNKLQQKNVN